MDTNLYGAWNAIQAMLPLLRASAHPRVVNIASGAGFYGDEHYGLSSRQGTAASYGISAKPPSSPSPPPSPPNSPTRRSSSTPWTRA